VFYKCNIKLHDASNDNNDETTHNYIKTIIKCKTISSIVNNHQPFSRALYPSNVIAKLQCIRLSSHN